MAILKNCPICEKSFKTKPYFLKLGRGIYCSNKCAGLSRRKGKDFKCEICNKEIYKSKKEILRSDSNKYFCSKKCQAIWRNKTFVGEKHVNWKGGKYTYKNVLKRSGTVVCCKICFIPDQRVLAVHHKDKNRSNNKVENLVYLCHNCHHLVHHYGLDQAI